MRPSPVIAPAALALLALVAAPLSAQVSPATPPASLPRVMSPQSIMALPAPLPNETIRYGDEASQKVELFLPANPPEGGGPLPVAVLIHGGCWQEKVAGIALVRAAAGGLAARGFAVWAVGYRRIDEPGGGYPGTYQDVARAIDLLAEQAPARNLDAGRTVFLGHSAGAHLALWAAARGRIPKDSPLFSATPLKPRGVVSLGGFGDLKGDSWVIKGVCEVDPKTQLANPDAADPWADTSPAAMLPIGVPIVMLHGVYDGVAFPELGLAFAQAVRKAGGMADVVLAPNAGHFEVIAPGARAFEQAVSSAERMVR
jgi:acetyl esterase/lipase